MRKYRSLSAQRSMGRIIFILTAVFAVAAVLIASLLFTAGSTEGKEAHTFKKIYSSMTVAEGDTLWDIGKRYSKDNETQGEYAENVMKLNNMKDDNIREGMSLIYYYYVAE